MFKNFASARFIIGFIIFILAVMVAKWSYDPFFHLLTAGMFILSMWIMHQIKLGHLEEIAALEQKHQEKILEIYQEFMHTDVIFEEIKASDESEES
jgi:hypothetical protein